MGLMPDYNDHSYVLEELKKSQNADRDQREQAREAHLFLNHRSGQWEPFFWNANAGKPRYTFDMTTPIVAQVVGEIKRADFDIKVKPAGGDATKDTAKTIDGLIRNIENISNASCIFGQSANNMVTAGIDGWRVVQKFVDDNSFDQDLVIEPIYNFIDRAWFDVASELQDRSDARFGWVLQGITKEEYQAKWPEGKQQSISTDRNNTAYYHQPDLVTVGEFYYIKEVDREIVLMSNGQVYEVNSEYEQVRDDLARLGITEERRRTRKDNIVYSRKLDGAGWLEDEQKTVFSYVPIIPTFGNYRVFENKAIYHGVVEKLLDPQRVMNYSMSREVEEGSLAPRAKYWMSQDQAAGFESTLQTLNTNSDPVQFFNPDEKLPGPPMQQGGAQINPGLRTISEAMRQMMGQTAGLFAANMGDNPNAQSGVAIEKLQNKGDNGTISYFESQEIAICHTARILIDSIPKVYDTERQVRVLKEDGSFDMTVLNQTVIDNETGQPVTLNDLSVGKYDVVCSAGPSFQNRQQETVTALTEIGSVDPSVIQLGGDILLNNITAPGMDLLAERKRQQLFQSGLIPLDQMTDEEQEQLQAQIAQQQEQGAQPDPATIIAMAEAEKAQAQTQKVVSDTALSVRKEDREDFKAAQQAQNDQIKAAAASQEADFKQIMAIQQMQMEQNNAIVTALNTQADTLKTLREAMGVDAIVGSNNAEAYSNQAERITETQEAIDLPSDNSLPPSQ